MRTFHLVVAFSCVSLAAAACGKDDESKPADPVAADPVKPDTEAAGEVDPAALAAEIGVEPGGFAVEEGVGADAVATGTGTVEVRRTGEEIFAAAQGDIKLYAGDQLRTGEDSSAQIVLVDETVIELAESTAVAIGDRAAGADPASSAAVMSGVARFSVAARGPGEGPFLVYTPGGVIGTKGTTFGVGVSVSGQARVGVEEGEVEVAGLVDLEKAVALKGSQSVLVGVDGAVAEPGAFADDDWGVWLDETEAAVEPEAVVAVHTARLDALTPEIEASYQVLADLEADLDVAEGEAEEFASAGNKAGYRQAAPAWGATVEAEFLASQRLQHLSFAALTHAYLANAVYVRHPKKVEKTFVPARRKVAGAVLWHKRYHGTVHLHVQPRRDFYYRHHPRGRVHAAEAKVEMPAFYRGKLDVVADADVRSRVKIKAYRPPVIRTRNKAKRVVVSTPAVDWRAGVKVKVRDHRSKAGWYVRPKTRKASVVTGVKVTAPRVRVFGEPPRVGRADVKVRLGAKGAVGVKSGNTKVRVGPKGTAGVRVEAGEKIKGVRIGPKGGVRVKVKGGNDVKVGPKGGVSVKGGAGVKVKAGGGVKVKAPATKVKVKAGVGAKVKAPATKVKVKAGGGVKVKAPGVKVKAPKVKAPKVKASGGVKVKAGAGVKVKTKN